MDSAELKNRVRELRAEGRSPKEIARTLGVSPSVVAPLVRAVAAEGSAAAAGEPEVAGCWINVGWSNGLTVDPARGWIDEKPDADGLEGKVCVLVARRHKWDRMTVCGYLADVYCTGVKDLIGPDVIDDRQLSRFREYFFSDYAGWQEAPIELAQHLVFGSVDYARTLGLEPFVTFDSASHVLGTWEGGPSAITFGRDGKPFYVPGENDESGKIVRILERKVGPAGFDTSVE
ncbi:helix-turn-helix domain-containing protein [Nonomuraea aurantiaca]|uniref:helix-turn-helix domain-containing protein n=1 Tax=Nonomuraea aurantiaca TaxID=2878562 RepID=UPI001CD9A94B|nr:helix-turn-helix domain-containing protein [Nonomuraea aurantiaca]MCA2221055.1 helix-turn-helix domain-containing protein [Nonomuraea aurantiaca]